jgi:putative phosphoesterase
MRIGVISDTHDHMANVEQIVALLNRERVDRVVHTGDITKAKTLRVLSGLKAPLVGVYGNNDLERESLEAAVRNYDFRIVDPPLRVDWLGRRVVVVHDPKEHADEVLLSGDVLLHGHDHRHRVERRNGTLIFNPGECAGHMKGYNAVGVLELTSLETRLLLF